MALSAPQRFLHSHHHTNRHPPSRASFRVRAARARARGSYRAVPPKYAESVDTSIRSDTEFHVAHGTNETLETLKTEMRISRYPRVPPGRTAARPVISFGSGVAMSP